MQYMTTIEAQRDRLESALGILAALVAKDTAFLPFFQRLEVELDQLNIKTSALDRAKLMAARQRATR